MPALGGEGLQTRIASFGYYPRWSPDGSQILFQTAQNGLWTKFYVVGLEGNAPSEVLMEVHEPIPLTQLSVKKLALSAAWLWEDAYVLAEELRAAVTMESALDTYEAAAGRGLNRWRRRVVR